MRGNWQERHQENCDYRANWQQGMGAQTQGNRAAGWDDQGGGQWNQPNWQARRQEDMRNITGQGQHPHHHGGGGEKRNIVGRKHQNCRGGGGGG
jgi:hypothetical protein